MLYLLIPFAIIGVLAVGFVLSAWIGWHRAGCPDMTEARQRARERGWG